MCVCIVLTRYMGYRWDADVGLYVCRDRAVKFSKDVEGDDLVYPNVFPMSYRFLYLLMTLIYSLKQTFLILYKPLLIGKWAKL